MFFPIIKGTYIKSFELTKTNNRGKNMKLKLSKKTWKEAGKKAGWDKVAEMKEIPEAWAGFGQPETFRELKLKYPNIVRSYETLVQAQSALLRQCAQYDIAWKKYPELQKILDTNTP